MNIAACVFTTVIALVLPVSAVIFYSLKINHSFKPALLGALTFLIFQVFLRLPMIEYVLPGIAQYSLFSVTQPVLYSIFLGVTAGLFEEFGRYFIIKIFLKQHNDIKSAVNFGIGHGGIEAILFVGINALFLIFTSPYTVNYSSMYAAGVERLAAMIMHIGWSVMVMNAVRSKKFIWVITAFVTHSLIDSTSAILQLYGIHMRYIEAILILLAVIMSVYIVKKYRKEVRVL